MKLSANLIFFSLLYLSSFNAFSSDTHNYQFSYSLHYKCYQNVLDSRSSYFYDRSKSFKSLENTEVTSKFFVDDCDENKSERIEISANISYSHGYFESDTGIEIVELKVAKCFDRLFSDRCSRISEKSLKSRFKKMTVGEPIRIELEEDLVIVAMLDTFPNRS